MSTKAELQALLERVKAATGPDREIDLEIALFAGWTHVRMKGDAKPYWRKPGETQYFMRYEPPRYTASLDAITALIERELPGLCLSVGQNVHHFYWFASLGDVDDDGVPREVASGHSEFTAPLALTVAFLSAMIAQMEAEHAE